MDDDTPRSSLNFDSLKPDPPSPSFYCSTMAEPTVNNRGEPIATPPVKPATAHSLKEQQHFRSFFLKLDKLDQTATVVFNGVPWLPELLKFASVELQLVDLAPDGTLPDFKFSASNNNNLFPSLRELFGQETAQDWVGERKAFKECMNRARLFAVQQGLLPIVPPSEHAQYAKHRHLCDKQTSAADPTGAHLERLNNLMVLYCDIMGTTREKMAEDLLNTNFLNQVRGEKQYRTLAQSLGLFFFLALQASPNHSTNLAIHWLVPTILTGFQDFPKISRTLARGAMHWGDPGLLPALQEVMTDLNVTGEARDDFITGNPPSEKHFFLYYLRLVKAGAYARGLGVFESMLRLYHLPNALPEGTKAPRWTNLQEEWICGIVTNHYDTSADKPKRLSIHSIFESIQEGPPLWCDGEPFTALECVTHASSIAALRSRSCRAIHEHCRIWCINMAGRLIKMGIPFNTLYHQNTIDGLKAVGITDDMGDEAYAEARLTVADKVKKMQGKAAKAEAKLGEGEGETVQVAATSTKKRKSRATVANDKKKQAKLSFN